MVDVPISIEDLLRAWCRSLDTQVGFIRSITVFAVLWGIWRFRCSAVYGGTTHSTAWVLFTISEVIRDISIRFRPSRPSLLDSGVISDMGFQVADVPLSQGRWVQWLPPPSGIVKLNTDGSARDGLSSGAGVIRDDAGSVLRAFSSFYGEGTNTEAETRALQEGLQMCSEMGLTAVLVESDSEYVVRCIQGDYSPTHSIIYRIRRCRRLLQGLGTISHVFREANSVADLLAAEAYSHRDRFIYHTLGSLPPACIPLLQADRLGERHFRPP
jgi:ribonuclease HI